VDIEGRGNGHGVGMCQWGAIGRARAGQDYRTILTSYFPGTEIQRLY
jgi:stage II sporulation protein D